MQNLITAITVGFAIGINAAISFYLGAGNKKSRPCCFSRYFNTLQGYICNSRLRRFGKLITTDMLVAYYSKGCDSKTMFSGLKISQSVDFKKHLNQYDVIHLDIQWCIEPASGPENVIFKTSGPVVPGTRKQA